MLTESGALAGFHAVKGWSSHPDQLWDETLKESGSQYTNPWTSINCPGFGGIGGEIPEAFQSPSISA